MSEKIHSSFSGLLHSFDRYPDRIAITDKNGVNYTYSDFYKRIAWCRKNLEQRGVTKGNRVLLAIPMTMELYAMMEALFSLGAVIVFLDPWLKGRQMSAIIRQVKPKMLLCTPKIKWAAMVMPACWAINKWFSVGKLNTSDEQWTVANISDDDTALITFTGGSSGAPKGADRSFGFLAAQMKVLKPHLLSADGVCIDYCNFPMVGLADFAVGNHLVIPKIDLRKLEQAKSEDVWKTLVSNKVTRTITSPSLLAKIKQAMDDANSSSNVRAIVTGGAPIPYTLIDGFTSDFPALDTEAIYGSTEAEPVARTDFKAMKAAMQTPLHGIFSGAEVEEIELKIIEPTDGPLSTTQFEELEIHDGGSGEIVVRGDHVNKGYYENQKAFEDNKIIDAFGQIWHRTGDVGYRGPKGIYLVGRIHRIINMGGKKFHPYPLELYLEIKLGIKDAAYVQDSSGDVILHLGKSESANDDTIFTKVAEANYPLTKIKRHTIDLPRDARHRSKLDLNALLKL